jgi:Putative bacterial sensory transduction regulator
MTPAQAELHTRTSGYLSEAFGELVKHSPDGTAFFVPLGRIGIRVEVEPVGDDNALLQCYAWIGQDLVIDEAIASFLAHRNAGLRFGALCVDGEGAVIFRHALFPESVTKTVLARLVEVMADSADTIDQELQERAGRATD